MKERVNKRLDKNINANDETSLDNKAPMNLFIRADKNGNYADVAKWLDERKPQPNNVVLPVMAEFNVFMDKNNGIREQSKFDIWADHAKYKCPNLL